MQAENIQINTAPGVGSNGGSVAFIYRQNINECGGFVTENGKYRYSISTDGGINWNVGDSIIVNPNNSTPVGHCFGNGPVNPVYTYRSRYPNLSFLAKGPQVSDLDLVYVGPVVTPGISFSWNGNVHGLVNEAAGNWSVAQEEYLDQGGDQFIAYSLVERVPGEHWYVSSTADGLGNATTGINLNKGIYDAGSNQINWTKHLSVSIPYSNAFLQSPLNTTNPRIAFSPDGTTGYVAFLGDLSGGRDSIMHVCWMSTTNGGLTWTDPVEFDMERVPELIEHINFFKNANGIPLGTGIPTTAFHFDLTIDANNNPHIFAVVGNGNNFSIQSGLKLSVFDFTKDEYGDWNMAFVADQGTFRGLLGSAPASEQLIADPWIQASRSPDGSVVYVFWTDTDTTGNFGSSDNNQPNLIGRAFDVDNWLMSDIRNFTITDPNWSGKAIIPKVAPVGFVNGNLHTLPVVNMDMPASVNDVVFFWYFSDVSFDVSTDLITPPSFFYNCEQNPILAQLITQTPVCGASDGIITLSASGGLGALSYQWDAAAGNATTNSVSGLAAGIYQVTVTDSTGCTNQQNIHLNNSTAPLLFTTALNPTCTNAGNGQINLNVVGFSPPYTYLWSNGSTSQHLSNAGPGIYTVQVQDVNGCFSFAQDTIIAPASLGVELLPSDVLCQGENTGALGVNVFGGTPPYQYNWSNGETTPNLTQLYAGSYSVSVTDAQGCIETSSAVIEQPNLLTVTTDPTPSLNCSPPHTGTITAMASGGTAPYIYQWTGPFGFSSSQGAFVFLLPGGAYEVTVTDANGCSLSQVALVNPLSNQSAIVQDAACDSSGFIDIIPDPSWPSPVQYFWSTGDTTEDLANIPRGIYSVTVLTGNGCSYGFSAEIQDSIMANLSGTASDLSCYVDYSGSIDLTPTGTPPFHFAWSNGDTTEDLSGLGAGYYAVTVTDSIGCVAEIDFTLTEPSEIQSSLDFFPFVYNDTASGYVNLSVSGGTPPYNFLWNNGATTQNLTDLTAGTYAVLITDAQGCSHTDTALIQHIDSIALVVFATVDSGGLGTGTATVNASGGIPPYSYYWSTHPAQNTATAIGLSAGIYQVAVIDALGFSKTSSVEVIADTTTSISGMDRLVSVKLYPNPANHQFSIELHFHNAEATRISLFDMMGNQVGETRNLEKGFVFRETWTTEKLAAGIYLVRVETTQGMILKKLQIEK